MIAPALIFLTTGIAALPADSALWQVASPAYENPVVKQWMLPASHSAVGGGYSSELSSEPIDFREGRGQQLWAIDASTYLKHKSSTLWGSARYDNGIRRDVSWNETADASLIYPYLTADSVGGNLNFERYSFGGGYADHTDSWAWGASLSYTAGLYYRNIDPRPRNVTGLLDLSAGAARRIAGEYFAGVSVNFRKYKQTSSIDFKSQLGVEKIYHLTGLATHYHRFAGTGAESYYNGNRYGMTANIYSASGSGLALTANLSRFRFDKILTGLNKLPLAGAWHNEMTLQAAWLAPGHRHDWGMAARFDTYRRHGHENVFGDASSNIYPLIASLDMYADNYRSISAEAVWQYHPAPNGLLLYIKAIAAHNHRSEVYASPRRRMLLNRLNTSAEASLSIPVGQSWRLTAEVEAGLQSPLTHSLTLAEADSQLPAGLVAMESRPYDYLTHRVVSTGIGVALRRQLTQSIGLRIAAGWNRTAYTAELHNDLIDASLSVIF